MRGLVKVRLGTVKVVQGHIVAFAQTSKVSNQPNASKGGHRAARGNLEKLQKSQINQVIKNAFGRFLIFLVQMNADSVIFLQKKVAESCRSGRKLAILQSSHPKKFFGIFVSLISQRISVFHKHFFRSF